TSASHAHPRPSAMPRPCQHPHNLISEPCMPTGDAQTRAKIRGYILENIMFSSNDGDLGDTASLLDRGIIDSTGVLEIVLFLEEQFQVKVKDSDLLPSNFDTVDNIVGFVSRLRAS